MADKTAREQLEVELEQLDAKAGGLYDIADQLDATEREWAARVREHADDISRMVGAIRRLIAEAEGPPNG